MIKNICLLICVSILVSCMFCSYPKKVGDNTISITDKKELSGMREDMLKSAGSDIPERRIKLVQINAKVPENDDAITILEDPPADKILLAIYTATGKKNENLMPLMAKGIYMARKATNARYYLIDTKQEEYGIKKSPWFKFWSQNKEPYSIYSIEIKCYDAFKGIIEAQ